MGWPHRRAACRGSPARPPGRRTVHRPLRCRRTETHRERARFLCTCRPYPRRPGRRRAPDAWWRERGRSTRSTRAASPTATATASATCPACGRGCPTWPTSASTPSGSARSTRRRMADAGYDVSDYRDVDPLFGTLDRRRDAVAEAHALGLRVHRRHRARTTPPTSTPWFQAALAAAPGLAPSAARLPLPRRPRRRRRAAAQRLERRLRRPGVDPGPEPDGARPVVPAPVRARSSPTSTGPTPRCAPSSSDVLRFWFDRGVDGFRIDVAHGAGQGRRRCPTSARPTGAAGRRPQRGRPPALGPRRRARDLPGLARGSPTPTPATGCSSPRRGCPTPSRLARYLRPDELHTAFNFDFLAAPWEAGALRDGRSTRRWRRTRAVGAPPTWVLSNHDVVRHVSRYGRADTACGLGDRRSATPADLALGAAGPGRPRC